MPTTTTPSSDTASKKAIKTADFRAMSPEEQATSLGNLLAAMDADPRAKVTGFKKSLINATAVKKAAAGDISEAEYRLTILTQLQQSTRLYLSLVGNKDGKVATGVNLDGSDGTVESNIQRQAAFRAGVL